MHVELISRQRAALVHAPALSRLATWLLQQAIRRGRPRAWSQLTLVLLDDRGITEVNRRVFQRGGPTDVISLTYRPLPGAAAGWSGELFINVQRAEEEGRSRPGGPDRELALYVAHGCDHLTGGLDHTPPLARAMRRRELRWLQRAAAAGLLDRLAAWAIVRAVQRKTP